MWLASSFYVAPTGTGNAAMNTAELISNLKEHLAGYNTKSSQLTS